MFLETKDPRAAKRTEASPTKESVSNWRRFGLDGSKRGRNHTQTRVAPFRPCLPRCATRSVHKPCQQQGDSGFSKRCSTSIVRSKQLAGLQTSKFAILLQVLDTGMNSSVNSNHAEHAPRAGRLKCSVELDA